MLKNVKDNKITIVSIIFSLAALVVSIIGILIAKESLNFNKSEAEKRRKVNIIISADWARDRILVTDDDEHNYMDSTISGKLYGLMRGLAELKIANNSERPITIDKVNVEYVSQKDSSVFSFRGGSLFIKNDSLSNYSDVKFPVKLNPYEALYFTTFIPIPISGELRDIFKTLKRNELYQSKDILLKLMINQLIKAKINTASINLDSLIAQANTIIALTGNLSNVPEMLILYSDKNNVKRRGERVLEISVRLSTGENIVQKLDYFDIRKQDKPW